MLVILGLLLTLVFDLGAPTVVAVRELGGVDLDLKGLNLSFIVASAAATVPHYIISM